MMTTTALQSQEMPDILLVEMLNALPLKVCAFACDEFSLLSFRKYSIQLYYRSCNICPIEQIQKFFLRAQ